MEEHAEYAGRLLAGRYRLPLPPADAYEFAESPAWDTVGGQEVLVRQVPLPEVVEAEVVEADLLDDGRGGYGPRGGLGAYGAAEPGGPGYPGGRGGGRATRRPDDPAVRRAMEAAVAAAQLPDHPGLDQVFDVFVEDGGLWIVSEQVPARSLATLLSERPLSAHRAAEIAADLLAALGVVHVHGWVHRNVTARTVLICEDGRAMLTGLAAGAAEEALCGYDPLPGADEPEAAPSPPEGSPPGDAAPGARPQTRAQALPQAPSEPPPRARTPDAEPATWTGRRLPEGFTARGEDPYAARGEGRGIFGFEGIDPEEDVRGPRGRGARRPGSGEGGDGATDPLSARAARRGAIAAYREGAQRAVADTRSAERRTGGPGPEHGRAPHGAGESDHRPQAADWWSTAPDGGDGGGDGHHPPGALDDEVRWLPSEEDEVRPDALEGGDGGRQVERDEIYGPRAAGPYGAGVSPYGGSGPTALPGARRQDSRGVPAQWTAGPERPDETRRHLRGLPASSPNGEADEGTLPDEGAFHGDNARHREGSRQGGPAFPGEDGACAPEPAGVPADPPWGEAADAEAAPGRFRGPATALAAERARHARMTVVGPVTERWAPEQAGPVYENWRLAPPVGPAADLWALGALLFRAVQGHAPYPEDSAAELVQMVCAEPPAFAEDCGPLRPVVESLMRQDPTERPDFEELRGWLRSLVRSAPEPDVGLRTVTAPSLEPGGPSDPRRLPIVRRRGELVRRRRRSRRPDDRRRPRRARAQPSAAAPAPAPDRAEALAPARLPEYEPAGAPGQAVPRKKRERARRQGGAGPRRLGLVILGLVLLGMAAAVAFVMWFLPDKEESGGNQKSSVVVPEERDRANGHESAEDESGDKESGKGGDEDGEKGQGGKGAASSAGPGAKSPRAPEGYKTSRDPAGFRIAVPEEWDRRSANGRGQVRYNGGQVEMVVVGGRDSTEKYGKDPMTYQSEDEPELSAYRAADWASTGGLRRIDVGDTAMAEGTFSWREGGGRQVYARNRAMILDGRYHVLLVIGSKSHRAEIDRHFEAVADTYRVTGVR
ncbi:protein kinase [Streptomyces reniochalinae]|uniref:Serine/threonine protein kinase n=1 Tax=Streptomyces reniochalinae TaxID=2250578 RepID=A0A367EPB4_9ACTN|nr:protein kinase [Streptomyces reniochalinae]RCG19247.1 serine/threonine protein kinase [Streptomyces reniochalinae]